MVMVYVERLHRGTIRTVHTLNFFENGKISLTVGKYFKERLVIEKDGVVRYYKDAGTSTIV